MATQKSPDVIIAGAGIFGLACAWACLARGLSVAVLDAALPGSGASGGIVGALSPHVPDQWNGKKAFQLTALLSAEAFWAKVDDTSGLTSGYGRTGRVIPLTNAAAHTRAMDRARRAPQVWGDEAEWRVEDGAETLAPASTPFGVIYDTLSARLMPRDAVASLAAACERRGAMMSTNCPVEAFGPGWVSGPEGRIEAEAVILAAGAPGLAMLADHLGEKVGSGVKGQAAMLRAGLGARCPTIYADGVYIVPHADGRVAIGSTSETDWTDAATTDEKLDSVIETARHICPALRDVPVIERWAGVRPKARRRDPMLGALPGMGRVFVANGAFKIGFGIAHRVGDVLAAMVVGEHAEIPDSFTISHHLEGR